MIRILDTDTSIFALRHHPGVLQSLASLSPDDVAVAAMTEAELWYGAARSRDPERSRSAVAAFLAPMIRLPFDSNAAEVHASLRLALRATPIGERDLVIASVAVAHAGVLVTHNTREFARITGLLLEDWVGGRHGS